MATCVCVCSEAIAACACRCVYERVCGGGLTGHSTRPALKLCRRAQTLQEKLQLKHSECSRVTTALAAAQAAADDREASVRAFVAILWRASRAMFGSLCMVVHALCFGLRACGRSPAAGL